MRLPVNRLRGCEHDARSPRRAETLRPCRHATSERRIKRLDRRRSKAGPSCHRSTTRALIGRGAPAAMLPRPHRKPRRRPSEPPHCSYVSPPGTIVRLFHQVTGFGVVCLATYALFVGALVAGALL